MISKNVLLDPIYRERERQTRKEGKREHRRKETEDEGDRLPNELLPFIAQEFATVGLPRRSVDDDENFVDAFVDLNGDVLKVVRDRRLHAHLGGYEARVDRENNEVIVCMLEVYFTENEVERGLGRAWAISKREKANTSSGFTYKRVGVDFFQTNVP
jgi:hypothetical protein